MSVPQSILLLFPALTSHNRRIIEGLRTYARTHGRWALAFEQIPRSGPVADAMFEGAAAIVTHMSDRAVLDQICSVGRPVVNTIYAQDVPLTPLVTSDNARAGILAADDYLHRGFRHFAYIGPRGWSAGVANQQRHHGFAGRVLAEGYACAVYDGIHRVAQESMAPEAARLAPWLAALPKPVAVLAFNDRYATVVLEAARMQGLRIPQELAVMGVQNDEVWCELGHVALSSIDLGGQRIGFRAAAVLDAMLQGEPPPSGPVLIEPVGVVTRQSTDVLAIDDADVAEAVRFVRANAGRPLRVTDVLAHVPVSRRGLERRFRAVLGRSINDEIRSAHVELAKSMLAETDLPLPRVARSCGLGSREYFSVVFRSATGFSPAAYRRRFRLASPESWGEHSAQH